MASGNEHDIAIIGCGPSGSFIVNLLKQSGAHARLIAVDDSDDVLNSIEADRKVLVRAGEKFDSEIDFGKYKIALFINDPSEGSSLTYAQALSVSASINNTYTYGFMIRPIEGWNEDASEIFRSFDAAAIIDAGWIYEKREKKDREQAIRISFNFLAHTLTFITGAIASGKLDIETFKGISSGKVTAFAASSISQGAAVYGMTMSNIERDRVKAAMVFVAEDIGDVDTRRIILDIARSLPGNTEIQAIRTGGLEPFRIVALLSCPA